MLDRRVWSSGERNSRLHQLHQRASEGDRAYHSCRENDAQSARSTANISAICSATRDSMLISAFSAKAEAVQVCRSDERSAVNDDDRLGVHDRPVPVSDLTPASSNRPGDAPSRSPRRTASRRGKDQLHVHAAAAGRDEDIAERRRRHGILVRHEHFRLRRVDSAHEGVSDPGPPGNPMTSMWYPTRAASRPISTRRGARRPWRDCR